MTAVACFVPPRPAVALGVVGGGLLVGVSYWSLKSSVTALVDLLAAQLAGQLQRHGHVGGDGLQRQQVEVLEDHPDLAAEAAQTVGIQRGDVFAIDLDAAAAGFFQAIDQA